MTTDPPTTARHDGDARPAGDTGQAGNVDRIRDARQTATADRAVADGGDPRRWSVLTVMVVCLVVVSLDNTILNVALKTIQQDLGASQGDMQWAVNAYTLVFAGLTFTFGLLADRYGRRPVLLLGMAVFGGGSALSAWAATPGQLIATRALMGIGAATIFPATLSIITNVFPTGERAKAIGLWSASAGVGVAIGPVTGGYLLEHWWWGSVFLVNVPFVVLGVIAIATLVPNSRDPEPGRIDPLGVALSTVGIIALVYGIIRAGDTADWTRPDVLGPLAGGVALLASFAVVERRSDHPALDITLFRQRTFSAAAVSVTLVFFSLMGLAFVLTYYLQAVRGASPLRAGVLLLPAAFGIAAGSAVAPRLARPLGIKLVVTGGMLLAAAGFTAYLWVGRSTPTWAYELPILAVGTGIGLALAPATESVMSAVPRATAGAGAAVNSTMRLVGAALGVAVLGALLAASYRTQLGDAADVLPQQYRGAASGSIAGTLTAVEQATAEGRQAVGQGRLSPQEALRLRAGLVRLVDAADDAFVDAMHVTTACGAAVSVLGALVALIWLPGRPRRAGDRQP